jgi:hypothetical protein
MSNRMKYIVFYHEGIESFYLIPNCMKHSSPMIAKSNIISAGFVQWTKDGVHCYGESVSLNCKSRGDVDSRLINKSVIEDLGMPWEYNPFKCNKCDKEESEG